MLTVRLVGPSSQCLKGLLNTPVKSSAASQHISVLRLYSRGRSFVQRSRTEEIKYATKQATSSIGDRTTPLKVGQLAVAGGAALGLGSLCYYGLGLSNEPGALDLSVAWPKYVQSRIQSTYMYFGVTCAATAASAVAFFRSPVGQRFHMFCARHPIMSTVGIIATLCGTGAILQSIPYEPGFGLKQIVWLANCGILGLALSPIGALGGALAIRAGWYTAGIVGGLTTVAACAPSEKFLTWAGPLGIGLGGVVVATIGSAIFPPTTALGLSLYSASLYGGLLVFSGLLLFETQRIIRTAETHPNWPGVRPYDPINASYGIVLDTINIFVRIIQILAMGNFRKK